MAGCGGKGSVQIVMLVVKNARRVSHTRSRKDNGGKGAIVCIVIVDNVVRSEVL